MNQQINNRVRLAAIVAICCGALACTNQETSSVVPAQVSEDASDLQSSQTEQAMDTDEQVSIARQGLAKKLGVEVDEIDIESVRAVHWRSGAAGCPKPGMSYTMAIVPGLQILLSVDGDVYRYHAAANRAPKFCPADRAEAPAYGQGEEVM